MAVRDSIIERTNPGLALRHWAGWLALAAVWTGVIWAVQAQTPATPTPHEPGVAVVAALRR